MFPVIEILVAISIQLLFVFANPIFWAIMGFVAFQYMRMSKFKEQLFKTSVSRWLSTTLQATGYGVVGGFIGSFIMIFLGLTLSGMGLIYIWPLALLLMIINPRFICFAYAGGILSLTNLLFGWPPIEVSQILALVAILHLVESILIYYNGHANAVPIYAKIEYDKGNSDLQTRSSYITAGENKLVGGFLLQRFWPIPLAVLIILESDIAKAAEMLKMPDWWPIFQPAVYADPEMLLLGLIPVVAALGYGDMAFSRKPVQKTKLSAFYLFGYSVILLLLAILSEYLFIFGILAAMFSFLGHEAIIYISRKIELLNKPIYVPPRVGVKALDILEDTPAFRAGIRSGDIILSVNDIQVNNKTELEHLIKHYSSFEISFISDLDKKHKRAQVTKDIDEHFGILPVPEGYEDAYVQLSSSSILKRWLEKGAKYEQ